MRPEFALLRENNRRKGFFEPDQYRALLKHMPNYLKPVIETAYITGWRVNSEILTWQKHHVDLEAGWLRLDPGETKDGEGRNFPRTEELRALMQKQVEETSVFERETDQIIPWLFHKRGKQIGSFRKAWSTACKKAGLAGCIPHDLRRTAVRNLERAAVPRSAAMALVGHRTESIYRRYAIVDEGMLIQHRCPCVVRDCTQPALERPLW